MFYYNQKHCAVPVKIHTEILPSQQGLQFSERGGGGRSSVISWPKKLKKCMKLNLEFPEGWGISEKIPSVGEVWIFSGIKQQIFWNCAVAYLAASAFCKPQQFWSLLVNQGSNCTCTEWCASWLHLVSSLRHTRWKKKCYK